jgi:hypothetical protein
LRVGLSSGLSGAERFAVSLRELFVVFLAERFAVFLIGGCVVSSNVPDPPVFVLDDEVLVHNEKGSNVLFVCPFSSTADWRKEGADASL